jgi:glycosyltransferase involved in cell wall biosynthesis
VEQLRVSFIIPVLNGGNDIARCLASIQHQRFPSEQYEVLVVDNGSTDSTHQMVRDLGFTIQVMPGVTVAALRNCGAKKARGEYLAFVDADVELMARWLQEGIALFEQRSIVAAGCFPRPPRPTTWVQQAWEIHQRGNRDLPSRRPVRWLPSMNLLVRRDIFLAIGGFDENLVTAEDVDLCYRLGQHGILESNFAMDAVHWGEAADVKTFWRKEVWRGMGNLRGIMSHGLRWDELPSIGYPLYVLSFLFFLGVSCILALGTWDISLVIANLSMLVLPALLLSAGTSWRTSNFHAFPKLFILYFLYGVARAFSLTKTSIRQTTSQENNTPRRAL